MQNREITLSEMNIQSCVTSCINGRPSKYNNWSEIFPWLKKGEDGLDVCDVCQSAGKMNAYSRGIRISVLRSSRLLKHELSKDHLDASGQQRNEVMTDFKSKMQISSTPRNRSKRESKKEKLIGTNILDLNQDWPEPGNAEQSAKLSPLTDIQPIVRNPSWKSAFFKEADNMRSEGFLCDVEIHFFSHRSKFIINGHKLILASASADFAEFFKKNKECNVFEITLTKNQYTQLSVDAVINYLYGIDPLWLSHDVVQNSIELAEELGMSHVVSDFSAFLADISAASSHEGSCTAYATDSPEEEKLMTEVFSCEICCEKFLTKMLLRKHKQSKHRLKSRAKHACTLCEKSFSRPYRLREHMNQHSGVQSYLCPHCGSMFSSRDSLLQHLRTHQGSNRPKYLCHYDLCAASFVKRSSLTLHIKVIHKKLTKQYVCEVCDKAFSWPQVLRNHRLTHQPFKKHSCEHCESCFHTRAHLNRHRKTHEKLSLHDDQLDSQPTVPQHDPLQGYDSMHVDVSQTAIESNNAVEPTQNLSWGFSC